MAKTKTQELISDMDMGNTRVPQNLETYLYVSLNYKLVRLNYKLIRLNYKLFRRKIVVPEFREGQ